MGPARQPLQAAKNLQIVGKQRISVGMAGVGVPMGPLQNHLTLDPVQRRWWCLPVGVTWGPPHLPLQMLHRTNSVLMGRVELSGCHSTNNTQPVRDIAGEQPQCCC